MSLNKKLLAGAVLAGLAFSANVSAIELGDDPLVFASEMEDGTELATIVDDVSFTVGYNFSGGEVRYGRYECSENMTMDNVTLDGTGAPNVALGAINGEGTNALFFSMTGGGGTSEDDVVMVVSDNTLEDGGSVSCAFSIYDQPSQAQAGGATGQIYTTGFDTVITRESGFVFEMDPTGASQAVANVEDANGAYFGFDGMWSFGAYFGNLDFMAATGVMNASGAAIQLSDIFTSDTYVTVDGDFTAADGAWWDTYGWSSDLDDGTATFSMIGPGIQDFFGDLWFDATEADSIPESEYTATLHVTVQAGYEVADVGPIYVGEIVRNGTQLQAPLAQVPGGWISRMVLTNTGLVDRVYEISVTGESGNAIGTDSTLLVGLVPGNGTKVIELNEILLTFSGKRRATLNVSVAAPNNQIQGLYQIVSPDGALSNVIMVRPGLN